MVWRPVELIRGAGFAYPPVKEHKDTVTDVANDVQVMADEKDTDLLLFTKLCKEVDDAGLNGDIQA